MLSQLLIRNFAIIDQTELELLPGMTALTGETGAGKSILLDALGLVLGDRADTMSIRAGAQKAEITAVFLLDKNSEVLQWLQDHDLDQSESCILRRIVSKDNRSRGYINSSPVSLQMLKVAGEMLVNIHGQHEHQSLTNTQYQRQILDSHTGNTPLLNKLYKAFKSWDEANKRFEKIESEISKRSQRIDMLQFQLQEFEALDLDTEELLSIESDHTRAANAGKLFELAASCHETLYESENAAFSILNKIGNNLSQLVDLDDRCLEIQELVSSASIQCSEAATELKHYIDKIDADPQKLQWFDQRLSNLHSLAKKHRVQLTELVETADVIRSELDELKNSDLTLENLDKQRLEKESDYRKIADQLSLKRRKSAKTMSKAITSAMQELAMTGGVFDIQVTSQSSDRPSVHGLDDITFLVSANPGQKPRPLGKVASGGELSRISLAIQLIASKHQSVGTLIFDEVDSGIGGAVAETVGQFLRVLSNKSQIMCVTHLPQVASQAHNHYQVSKSTDGKHTKTELIALDEDQTVEEIARMLGGKRISKQTRDHAREMLSHD